MKIKLVWLGLITGLVVSMDQLTKIYIHTHFSLHESFPVISHFFNLTYITNKGAAFGFLSQNNSYFRDIFFMIMPPSAMLIILFIMKDLKSSDSIQIFALSLIFSGALGNYIDRIKFGCVVDFLDFYIKFNDETYNWPAFNIADISIVAGVLILIYFMIWSPLTHLKR